MLELNFFPVLDRWELTHLLEPGEGRQDDGGRGGHGEQGGSQQEQQLPAPAGQHAPPPRRPEGVDERHDLADVKLGKISMNLQELTRSQQLVMDGGPIDGTMKKVTDLDGEGGDGDAATNDAGAGVAALDAGTDAGLLVGDGAQPALDRGWVPRRVAELPPDSREAAGAGQPLRRRRLRLSHS